MKVILNTIQNPNLLNNQYRLQSVNKITPQNSIIPAQPASKNQNKKAALVTATCVLGLVASAVIIKKGKKAPSEIFDVDYKKQLLGYLGIPEDNIEKLKSIAGKEEFLDFLSKNQDNKEIFSVGENLLNVKKRDFGANFHIHTLNSDGRMSVSDLLNVSSKYADKYFEKHKKPFFIAITDHNTINGDIEALDILAKNPEKYKNLRVVLGAEINAISGDDELHTLIYGINPYKSIVADKLTKTIQTQKQTIEGVIGKANNIYEDITKKYNFEFSFDDMAKIRPSIKYSPCDVKYSLKDYMQFRTIWADVVENNSKLTSFLKEKEINLGGMDFSIPKKTIPQNQPKLPYYKNYEDELYKYIEKLYKDKTGAEDLSELRKCYKKISPDVQNTLDELEYKTISRNEPLYLEGTKYDTLSNILNLYNREENSVCGIAHPCLTYKSGVAKQDTKENRERLAFILKEFDEKIKNPKISESYYQSYYKDRVTDDWKNYAKNLADENHFLHSGSYDSHNNTPFTNNKFLPEEFVWELLEK